MIDGGPQADRAPTELERVAHLLGVGPERLVGGLNLVEAARLLGIAPSTLRERALAAKIGHQRDGRAWRFLWCHLADYVTAREHPAASSSGEGDYDHSSQIPRELELERGGSDVEAEAIKLGLL